jgi:hypothetical protein
MPGEPTPSHDSTTATQPTDEEMRAAYEAELNRITSTEMILQTAVSLLNIGGRRLGLTPPSGPGSPTSSGGAAAGGERDLDQVSDAIDAVRALMPILERRMPREIGPLRDAVSQLQMAYAREVQAAREPAPAAPTAGPPSPDAPVPPQTPPSSAEGEKPAPGPAESSGRLWVPGR